MERFRWLLGPGGERGTGHIERDLSCFGVCPFSRLALAAAGQQMEAVG